MLVATPELIAEAIRRTFAHNLHFALQITVQQNLTRDMR